MKNVPSRATSEASPSISRRSFLRSTTGAVMAASAALTIAVSSEAASLSMAEADPIIAEIERHRCTLAVFENAAKGASDEYLDSEEFQALSDAEIVSWRSLIETQPTTLAGLAAFAAYILHSPSLQSDMDHIRSWLGTIAIGAAKFASLDAEAGR